MYSATDVMWTLVAAILVFFMQAGFALCEAGLTRAKNTGNILMKKYDGFLHRNALLLAGGLWAHVCGSGAVNRRL